MNKNQEEKLKLQFKLKMQAKMYKELLGVIASTGYSEDFGTKVVKVKKEPMRKIEYIDLEKL